MILLARLIDGLMYLLFSMVVILLAAIITAVVFVLRLNQPKF